MTFTEYLIQKKINPETFKTGAPDLWEELENIFSQVHPKSFTVQKLYLINPIRRKYPLAEENSDMQQAKRKPGKPVIRKVPKQK